ncbi:hypothetical protein C8F01DRAFT_1085130 [Mycena amicta]|nr:hypothetical protein C8F01DRAFT_1085130 [Mycena amicta]
MDVGLLSGCGEPITEALIASVANHIPVPYHALTTSSLKTFNTLGSLPTKSMSFAGKTVEVIDTKAYMTSLGPGASESAESPKYLKNDVAGVLDALNTLAIIAKHVTSKTASPGSDLGANISNHNNFVRKQVASSDIPLSGWLWWSWGEPSRMISSGERYSEMGHKGFVNSYTFYSRQHTGEKRPATEDADARGQPARRIEARPIPTGPRNAQPPPYIPPPIPPPVQYIPQPAQWAGQYSAAFGVNTFQGVAMGQGNVGGYGNGVGGMQAGVLGAGAGQQVAAQGQGQAGAVGPAATGSNGAQAGNGQPFRLFCVICAGPHKYADHTPNLNDFTRFIDGTLKLVPRNGEADTSRVCVSWNLNSGNCRGLHAGQDTLHVCSRCGSTTHHARNHV